MNDHFDELISSESTEERAQLRDTWDLLGDLDAPEPPATLRPGFQRALAAYQAALDPNAARPRLGPRRLAALAASVALAVGASGGFLLADRVGDDGRMAVLESRLDALQRSQALVMMEHRSTAERLRGVRLATQAGVDDPQTQEGLLERALLDDNLNVRLAAIEAIEPLTNESALQEALIDALLAERSPIVQAALLELLIERRVRALLPVLDELAGRAGIQPEVQTLLQRGRSALRS